MYCKDLGKIYEATAFLTLEHAAHLAELYTKLEQANDRISLLEQKIEKKVAM